MPPLIESYLECTSEDMPTTRVIAPTSHQRILMKGCVLEILSDFYSHDTMLVQVLAVALCLTVCLSVTSQCSIKTDGRIQHEYFLPPICYPTVCRITKLYNKSRVFTKIRVFASGTLSITLDLENFATTSRSSSLAGERWTLRA